MLAFNDAIVIAKEKGGEALEKKAFYPYSNQTMVMVEQTKAMKNSFCILINKSIPKVYFGCETSQEKDTWVESISNAVETMKKSKKT